MTERVVIIGSGQAGLQTAISLREKGFDGSVVLIGEEPASLSAPAAVEGLPPRQDGSRRTLLSAARFPARSGSSSSRPIRPSRSIAVHRTVTLPVGHRRCRTIISLLAARRPQSPARSSRRRTSTGCCRCGPCRDASAIRARLSDRRASSSSGQASSGSRLRPRAAVLGHAVRVLEVAERPLGRAVSPEISAFLLRAHRARGVAIDCGGERAPLRRPRRQGCRRSSSRAASACPPTSWSSASASSPTWSLPAQRGSRGGERHRGGPSLSSRPTRRSRRSATARAFPCRYSGGMARLELVQNAIDQGRAVAARLTGTPLPDDDVPWFWSDQFELKLQIAGISTGHTAAVVRGHPARGSLLGVLLQGRARSSAWSSSMPPPIT